MSFWICQETAWNPLGSTGSLRKIYSYDILSASIRVVQFLVPLHLYEVVFWRSRGEIQFLGTFSYIWPWCKTGLSISHQVPLVNYIAVAQGDSMLDFYQILAIRNIRMENKVVWTPMMKILFIKLLSNTYLFSRLILVKLLVLPTTI